MASNPDGLERLLQGNKAFANRFTAAEPELLDKLSQGQSPETLWLGCADSRIPETTVCDCKPGDIFVHRNIANVITPTDLNSSSVLAYSVGVLKVKRVIVCGHTKCGGATAALDDGDLGETLNAWLGPVRELRRKHQAELEKLPSTDARANRLAELNVVLSLEAVRQHPVVKEAMETRGLTIHGIIYDVPTGQLRLLGGE
ncbi:carbonic anhydrase [Trichodelitschia bisporula]|uniref:Carbonic anhydrase n=1 Tax=Trichodelitschia bisporula TaxID=703511 RepID=A0A6G1HYK1_9PEZI|nr:carbonic anhydrase [Trichodelitschia bisporula]